MTDRRFGCITLRVVVAGCTLCACVCVCVCPGLHGHHDDPESSALLSLGSHPASSTVPLPSSPSAPGSGTPLGAVAETASDPDADQPGTSVNGGAVARVGLYTMGLSCWVIV